MTHFCVFRGGGFQRAVHLCFLLILHFASRVKIQICTFLEIKDDMVSYLLQVFFYLLLIFDSSYSFSLPLYSYY